MRTIKNILAIMLVLTFLMPATIFASTNQDISVTIDGTPVTFEDQQPVNIDGRTLVPVRGVFEDLGFDVHWDEVVQQVTLTNDINTIVMYVGSVEFTMNGAAHQLDVSAQIINGRTMVPLRAPP